METQEFKLTNAKWNYFLIILLIDHIKRLQN